MLICAPTTQKGHCYEILRAAGLMRPRTPPHPILPPHWTAHTQAQIAGGAGTKAIQLALGWQGSVHCLERVQGASWAYLWRHDTGQECSMGIALRLLANWPSDHCQWRQVRSEGVQLAYGGLYSLAGRAVIGTRASEYRCTHSCNLYWPARQ
jgi:hypothetical protein